MFKGEARCKGGNWKDHESIVGSGTMPGFCRFLLVLLAPDERRPSLRGFCRGFWKAFLIEAMHLLRSWNGISNWFSQLEPSDNKNKISKGSHLQEGGACVVRQTAEGHRLLCAHAPRPCRTLVERRYMAWCFPSLGVSHHSMLPGSQPWPSLCQSLFGGLLEENQQVLRYFRWNSIASEIYFRNCLC